MKAQIRSKILKELNSGRSASNIYRSIAMIIYTKRTYNQIFDYSTNRLSPSDFETSEFKETEADVEKIINNLHWDKKLIIQNFSNWTGMN